MKGDGLPVEFTVADRQEEMAALVPQYHNKEEKKLQLLSELPWTYAETSKTVRYRRMHAQILHMAGFRWR